MTLARFLILVVVFVCSFYFGFVGTRDFLKHLCDIKALDFGYCGELQGIVNILGDSALIGVALAVLAVAALVRWELI